MKSLLTPWTFRDNKVLSGGLLPEHHVVRG